VKWWIEDCALKRRGGETKVYALEFWEALWLYDIPDGPVRVLWRPCLSNGLDCRVYTHAWMHALIYGLTDIYNGHRTVTLYGTTTRASGPSLYTQ
jgi:hypothetical protein